MCALMLVLPLVLSAPASGARRSDASRLKLELLAAPALDTNAVREADAGDAQVSDTLLLVLWRAMLSGPLGGRRLRYVGSLEGGAKRFAEQDQEDTLILRYAGTLAARLGAGISARLSLNGKERHQPDARRSYRSGGGALGVRVALPGRLGVGLSGALRGFQYLPDETYDHAGAGGTFTASWRRDALDARLAASAFVMDYEGVRLVEAGEEAAGTVAAAESDPVGELRRDRLLRVSANLMWVGGVVVSGGGYLLVNRSNSVGSGMQRLGAKGALSIGLPLDVDLSLRGTLLLTEYDDPSAVADSADPSHGVEDDETRSSFAIALRRPLLWGFAAEMRWARYFNVGDGPEYQRDLFVVGLRYTGDL